jgi:hypothetical protein
MLNTKERRIGRREVISAAHDLRSKLRNCVERIAELTGSGGKSVDADDVVAMQVAVKLRLGCLRHQRFGGKIQRSRRGLLCSVSHPIICSIKVRVTRS